MLRFFVCFLLVISCFLASSGLQAAPVRICASILPQKTFAQAIGRDLVQVEVMVQPGFNPATYEPKPSQISSLTQTDVYFALGVPFERVWLDKFQSINPTMRIVHTEAGIEKLALPTTHDFQEHGDNHAGHSHEGIKDPHIWLSPPLVKKQAQNISRALEDIDPEHASTYRENLSVFLQEVDALHAELQDLLAPVQGRSFLVFHPAWGYLAHTYGLRQIAVEMEGKEPKPSQLARLISFARQKDIRAIFVQPQFSDKSARAIAREVGAQLVTADPLAGDWAANLRRQAQALRRVLGE